MGHVLWAITKIFFCPLPSLSSSKASTGGFTWTIFKNDLLEVGLTQNRETMALRVLITVDLFYFNMYKDPAWIEIH